MKRKHVSVSSSLIDSAIQYFNDTIRTECGITSDLQHFLEIFGQKLSDIKDSVVSMEDSLDRAESQVSIVQQQLSVECNKCNVLQDFLVNELLHAEQLEVDVLKLKELSTAATRERDFYKKIYESHIEEIGMVAAKEAQQKSFSRVDPTGSSSSGGGGTAILSRLLLKRYIRKCFKKKYFYGMVVSYTAPYYKVCLTTFPLMSCQRCVGVLCCVYYSDCV